MFYLMTSVAKIMWCLWHANKRWVWRIGEMILTREKWSTQRKNCSSASLFTTDPTWLDWDWTGTLKVRACNKSVDLLHGTKVNKKKKKLQTTFYTQYTKDVLYFSLKIMCKPHIHISHKFKQSIKQGHTLWNSLIISLVKGSRSHRIRSYLPSKLSVFSPWSDLCTDFTPHKWKVPL